MALIIAEWGVNANGNMEMAHELIKESARVGADISKTQLYSATALFGPDGADPNPELFEQMKWMDDIGPDQVKQFKKWCDEEGIEFMASAFDSEHLKWLKKVGVKRHKIASRSVKYTPEYCKEVLALEKETFVSLGMWEPGRYPDSTHARQLPFKDSAWARHLYCIATYPAPHSSLRFPDFNSVFSFGGNSNKWWGFSDHTIGLGASLIALSRGAQVIERHMTLDRSLPGPDHAASSTPDEMADLVKYAREIESVLNARES